MASSTTQPTRIAAQQPYFLPNFYFFYKMSRSRVFLLADHLKFRKQSPMVRARISPGQPPTYLTVPVQHGSNPHPPINTVRLVEDIGWKRRHLRTIKSRWGALPYFEYYFPALEEIYQQNYRFLGEFLLALLRWHIALLFPEQKIEVASERGIQNESDLTQWVDSQPHPVFLIFPEEREYYALHFPGIPVEVVEIPHHLSFPEAYTPDMALLALLFQKGPETALYFH